MSPADRYVDGDVITAETLDAARERCVANDQRSALVVGAQTWAITLDGGQRGQMSRWPDGRGAAFFGADSVWGRWDRGLLHVDDKEVWRLDPDGGGTGWAYDESGEVVYYDEDGA